VIGLEQVFTSRNIDWLPAVNINAQRSILSSGIVAWGARTLSSDPEWIYVPVRRTALFVEANIYQDTAWSVLEPSDEPLWAKIDQSGKSFLQTLFQRERFRAPNPESLFRKTREGDANNSRSGSGNRDYPGRVCFTQTSRIHHSQHQTNRPARFLEFFKHSVLNNQSVKLRDRRC